MITGNQQLKLSILVLVGMCAVILTALGFQHLGGYIPCKLCLEQREPWYFAIPIVALACLSAWRGGPQCLTRGLLAIGGIAMLYSLALAINHSGIEWKMWAGPTGCGAVPSGLATDTGNFLKQLNSLIPPSCEDAAGRFLGLSFAGWNGVASLVLAVLAFRVGLVKPYGSSSVSQ